MAPLARAFPRSLASGFARALSAGGWVPVKQAEYFGGEDSSPQARRGVVWAVLPSQLTLKDRIQPRAEMEILS